jgi:hypothetical protein
MTEQQFTAQRAKLVNEFWFLKSKRLFLSAKARIRKIADLDFQYKGIAREVTKQKFNYDKIKTE